MTHLWFSGSRISFDPSAPAYLGHTDEPDRVTRAPRSIAEDFRFLDFIEATPLYNRMSTRDRRALAVKILRIHVFDAIAARLTESGLTPGDTAELRRIVARLASWSRTARGLLSVADERALSASLRGGASRAEIEDLLGRRWRYRSPGTLVTRNPFLSLHRQAPFRTDTASARVRSAVSSAMTSRRASTIER